VRGALSRVEIRGQTMQRGSDVEGAERTVGNGVFANVTVLLLAVLNCSALLWALNYANCKL